MNITVTDANGTAVTVPSGTTVGEVARLLPFFTTENAVLAIIHNDICDFQTALYEDVTIRWLPLNTREGFMAYQRSLILLMVRAVNDEFPGATVKVLHTLGNALYCELIHTNGRSVGYEDIQRIQRRMRLIQREEPAIKKEFMSKSDCLRYVRKHGNDFDCKILESLDLPEITYYQTGKTADYYFGPMVPDFSYLRYFSLELYTPGFLLRYPDWERPRELATYKEVPKFAKVFLEAKEWGRMLDCSYVSQLNNHIHDGSITEIIDLAEALQEKRRAQMADYVVSQKPAIRLILVAGPSSAGKTTFTKRFCTQLKVNGLRPIMLSLDDYFVERAYTPRLPDGSYDFESIHAIDVGFFSQQLLALYAGEEVRLPQFNFLTGTREWQDKTVRLTPGSPVVVEGLHALNDDLSRVVPRYEKCKIYLGALTQLAINDHNRISTSYTRLVRRLVRDHQFRGHGAERTLEMWDNVRRGEESNIFPFQEDADMIFNSALLYELPVLKGLAVPLLEAITPESPYYYQAHQLLRFLSPFKVLDPSYVPSNSILKEFIG